MTWHMYHCCSTYLPIFLHFFGALWLEISWLLKPLNDDSNFRCSWQTYCQYQFTILYIIFSPWKIKIKKPSRLFIVMWLATQGELYWYPAGFLFPLLYSQLFRNLTRRRELGVVMTDLRNLEVGNIILIYFIF